MDQLDRGFRQEVATQIALKKHRGYGPPIRRRGGIGLGTVILLILTLFALLPRDTETDAVDGLCAELQVSGADGQEVTPADLEKTRSTIEGRVVATGLVEPSVRSSEPDRIEVALPGVVPESDDADLLTSLISTVGVLEFIPVPDELFSRSLQGEPLPEAMLGIEPIVDGSGITSARVARDTDTDEPFVMLQLDDVAAQALDSHAEVHFGERYAIVLDGIIESAPTITMMRSRGSAQIHGDYTVEAASDLVTVLHFGPLPLEIGEVASGACGDATTGDGAE